MDFILELKLRPFREIEEASNRRKENQEEMENNEGLKNKEGKNVKVFGEEREKQFIELLEDFRASDPSPVREKWLPKLEYAKMLTDRMNAVPLWQDFKLKAMHNYGYMWAMAPVLYTSCQSERGEARRCHEVVSSTKGAVFHDLEEMKNRLLEDMEEEDLQNLTAKLEKGEKDRDLSTKVAKIAKEVVNERIAQSGFTWSKHPMKNFRLAEDAERLGDLMPMNPCTEPGLVYTECMNAKLAAFTPQMNQLLDEAAACYGDVAKKMERNPAIGDFMWKAEERRVLKDQCMGKRNAFFAEYARTFVPN